MIQDGDEFDEGDRREITLEEITLMGRPMTPEEREAHHAELAEARRAWEQEMQTMREPSYETRISLMHSFGGTLFVLICCLFSTRSLWFDGWTGKVILGIYGGITFFIGHMLFKMWRLHKRIEKRDRAQWGLE